jgi:hypothetical protein
MIPEICVLSRAKRPLLKFMRRYVGSVASIAGKVQCGKEYISFCAEVFAGFKSFFISRQAKSF